MIGIQCENCSDMNTVASTQDFTKYRCHDCGHVGDIPPMGPPQPKIIHGSRLRGTLAAHARSYWKLSMHQEGERPDGFELGFLAGVKYLAQSQVDGTLSQSDESDLKRELV